MRSISPPTLTLDWQQVIASPPPLVTGDTPLRIVIAHMNAAQVGCVLVQRDTHLVGIFTQQDITRLVASKLNLDSILVSNVMHPPTILKHDQLEDINYVLRLLQQPGNEYLPVMNDQQQVIGLITPTDFCRQLQMITPVAISPDNTPFPKNSQTQGDNLPTFTSVSSKQEKSTNQCSERTIYTAYQELLSLIDHSPLVVVEWDSNFRLQSWSSQAEELFGWQADEVLGKHPFEWEFIHEVDREKVHTEIVNLIRHQHPQSICANRNYTRTGTIIHCRWYHSTLTDETGKIISILSLVLDITQQQQTEELLKRQLAAIETSIDGIAILDQENRYTYLNRAHANLFGYDDAHELLGKTWEEIYSADEMRRIETEVLPVFAGQGHWRGESVGKRQDGSLVAQEIALTRLDDGGLTCICRDITARKRFEEELMRSRAELETRIQERTEELSNTNIYLQAEILKRERLTQELAQAKIDILKALEQEKELNELKSRFITNTSHEFRTPLTIILGSLELLEYSSPNLAIEKKQKHFQRIRSAVQHMTHLLDDVLTISETEANKLVFSPALIDVRAFCERLLNDLKHSFASFSNHHDIQFNYHGSHFLAELDEQLLWQVLENLLSNAVKYSPSGGVICFDLHYTGEGVLFQIRDQGIGIPTADLPHLFEPFHRASNVKTIPGNGLGLAIVKRAIDLHGGEICMASEVNVGTVFTVKLPTRILPRQMVSVN